MGSQIPVLSGQMVDSPLLVLTGLDLDLDLGRIQAGSCWPSSSPFSSSLYKPTDPDFSWNFFELFNKQIIKTTPFS